MAVINAKAGWVVALCMAALVVAAVPLAEAITCGQVALEVGPCLPYLQNGGAPSGNCCQGVVALNNAASSTPDRQQACKCLQEAAAAALPAIKETFAVALPGKCGVNVPFKISSSTNCANVK